MWSCHAWGCTISLIFYVTFAHTNARHQRHIPIELLCPHRVTVLKQKKKVYPWGVSSLTVIVSIADHNHTFFVWDLEGSPLKITIKVYYVKSMGIKLMTSIFVRARDHFIPPLVAMESTNEISSGWKVQAKKKAATNHCQCWNVQNCFYLSLRLASEGEWVSKHEPATLVSFWE